MQNNRSSSTSRIKPTNSTDRLTKPVSTTPKASVRAPTKRPIGTVKETSNDGSCQRSTTGAFTMYAPDPQKRVNILRNAQAEADALKKFKQRNSMRSVHEVNRLGGKYSLFEKTFILNLIFNFLACLKRQ